MCTSSISSFVPRPRACSWVSMRSSYVHDRRINIPLDAISAPLSSFVPRPRACSWVSSRSSYVHDRRINIPLDAVSTRRLSTTPQSNDEPSRAPPSRHSRVVSLSRDVAPVVVVVHAHHRIGRRRSKSSSSFRVANAREGIARGRR